MIGAITLFVINRVRRGGFRRPRGFRRRQRRRWVLERLGRRLDTTAAQDRALGDALDDLWSVFSAERSAFASARDAMGDALRADELTDADIEELRAAGSGSQDRIFEAVMSALKTAHEVLDAEQRAELAELVRRGPPGCHGRHGRRSHLHAA